VSTESNQEPQQRSGLMTALVAGAILALIGANFYLYSQINDLRAQLTAEIDKIHGSMKTEIAGVREASTAYSASQTRTVEQLKADIASEQSKQRALSSQAKAEAIAQSEQHIRDLQSQLAQQQAKLASDISGARQAADTANAKIADVSTDVGTVKTNLDSTKAELQKTIADLKSVRGDLGVQSGLIATNSGELQALRRLGERNYFEFNIKKSKERQRVGDAATGVTLMLKSVDIKKNKYTLEVMADDKVTEKKDRTINEPVQFYTSKAKAPFELVVNKVQKDVVIGYLSTPKDTASR
jgi:chromosome segregation ATPase